MVFFLVCSFCFHLEHQIYKDFAAKTKSDLNNKMSTSTIYSQLKLSFYCGCVLSNFYFLILISALNATSILYSTRLKYLTAL